MNLAVVNEAVTGMNGVEHEFTEEEKNFVVQFAFRSGSKEDTISLIEALAHSTDKVQSEEIMVTYRSKYDIKPAWVEQAENLLVIKTISGMAMAVAAAIDKLEISGVVGTIAGDDTVMCAIRSVGEVAAVQMRIAELVHEDRQ